MLTAINLQFSLVPIFGSLADTKYLTLHNDLIFTRLAMSPFESPLDYYSAERGKIILAHLLLQHYLTLLRQKQPSEGYGHLLNHLTGLQQNITDCLVGLNAY